MINQMSLFIPIPSMLESPTRKLVSSWLIGIADKQLIAIPKTGFRSTRFFLLLFAEIHQGTAKIRVFSGQGGKQWLQSCW
jgi:hypothetical protein